VGRIKIDLLRDSGLIGAEVDASPRPCLAVSGAAHGWASAEWSSLGLSPDNDVVAINPGGRRAANRWPGRPALAHRIVASTRVQRLLLWGPGERELTEQVLAQCGPRAVLAPASSIEQLGALLARSALLIGSDSGARHIGVAVGTPTLTIRMGASPESWAYPGSGHRCVDATIHGGSDAVFARVFSAFEELMQQLCVHA